MISFFITLMVSLLLFVTHPRRRRALQMKHKWEFNQHHDIKLVWDTATMIAFCWVVFLTCLLIEYR